MAAHPSKTRVSDSLSLMYAGWGAGWRVEVYCKWTDANHARIGTKLMLAHLERNGIKARASKARYEPFGGTMDIVITITSTDDIDAVVELLGPKTAPPSSNRGVTENSQGKNS